VKPESASKDTNGRAPDGFRQFEHVILFLFDQVRAELGVPPAGEIAARPDAAADAIARIEDDGFGAPAAELSRRGEAGQTSADDRNATA
jgi:hypothetical protein